MKRLLLVVIVLAVACGPGTTPPKKSPSPVATTPVARPSQPPFPSPTAGGPAGPPPVAVVCSSQVPAGHQVALVSLHGVQGVVVRDVTDIQHPITRCTFQGGAYFRFVNSARVSYIVTSSGDLGASGALYMVDLNQSTTSLVRAWSSGGYGSWVYAWSPDGQKLTYLASDTTGVTLASLGTTPARGVALDNDDIMVGFSADGQYVAVESTFTTQKGGGASAPAIQIVRLSDLKEIYQRADGTMAAWGATGARLYFRTTGGVLVWEATGKVQTVNPQLRRHPHRLLVPQPAGQSCGRHPRHRRRPCHPGHERAARESGLFDVDPRLVCRRNALHEHHPLRIRRSRADGQHVHL